MQTDALRPEGDATMENGSRKQLALRTTSHSSRPITAPPKRELTKAEQTAQVLGSMLDRRPISAKVPGYTGHQPGMISESLLGRSYAYLTGYRKDLLFKRDEAWISEYDRTLCKEGKMFEPLLVQKPVNGDRVSRKAPQAPSRYTWGDRTRFNEVLNLSDNSRMPGYTGHVPHFKFQGSVGLPYAKACSTGDHLRAPDGSDNPFIHESPQHVGQPKNKIASDPIAGYSGYVPYMLESSCGHSYKDAVKICHETQAMDPAEVRKISDNVHAGYTPSMRKALDGIKPHGKNSIAGGGQTASALLAKKVEHQDPPDYIAGYGGFKPGYKISRHAPEQFKGDPHIEHRPDARGSTIYLGDLTQEWNLGTPYRCTNADYGLWSPLAGKKEPLWVRRR